MTLHLFAGRVDVDDPGRRVIAGLVVPYGTPGQTSAGPLTVAAGAIRTPPDLTRVKLLDGHDRGRAVAYATGAADTRDGLHMSFKVAPTPAGDLALVEAQHHTRDAFSVELDGVVLDGDTVTAAELVAVALLAVPAFPDARVAAVAAQRGPTMPETATPPAADTPDVEDPALDPDDDDDDTDGDAAPAPAPESVEASRRPAGLPHRAGRRAPQLSFSRTVESLRRTLVDRGPAALVAALTDITPAADPGQGFLRPQWLDELWTPVAATRHYIESVQHQNLTSGLKVYGWRWKTTPTVGPYAGNKAAIPTSPAQTEPAEAPVERFAGGWDIDRIYVDLGEPGFLESFFRAAAADLAQKQDAGVSTVLDTDATVAAETATELWSALDVAARTLQGAGASLSWAGISPDYWAAYINTPTSDVPWWVPAGQAPGLADSTGAAGPIRFFLDPGLDASTVLAGDRRAVTFYESPQVRVQAVNIPNGGVDLALFAYQATLVNDARGVVKVSAPPVGP